MTQFPAAQPAAITALADNLTRINEALYRVVGELDRAAITTSTRWRGAAASAFTTRMNAFSASVADTAEATASAVPALRTLAATIESARDRHAGAADLERRAIPHLPDTANAVAAAQRAQGDAVSAYQAAGQRCATVLQRAASRLAAVDVDPATPGSDEAGRLVGGRWFAGSEFDLMDAMFPRSWTFPAPSAEYPAPTQVPADRMPLPDGSDGTRGSTDPRVRWILPPTGEGYETYNVNDSRLGVNAPSELRDRIGSGPAGVWDQVGTRRTIESQQRLADEWAGSYPGRPLEYGDVSLQGGVDTNDHGTHGDGHAFDMRPVRSGTGDGPLTWQSGNYDQAATRDLLRIVRRQHPNATVYFNDPAIRSDPEFRGWVTRSAGHDNHLHVILPDD